MVQSQESFRVIGYPNADHYVNPHPKIDNAMFDNEDMGLTSAIVLQEGKTVALPYPADIDLKNETIVFQWMDIINQRDIHSSTTFSNGELALESFDLLLSLLKPTFTSTGSNPMNNQDDTNIVEFKKSFDGPYNINLTAAFHADGTDTATRTGNHQKLTGSVFIADQLVRYVPPFEIDLALPLFISLIDRSKLLTTLRTDLLGTDPGIVAASLEFVSWRIWYRVRKLTSAEKGDRGTEDRLRSLAS